MTRGMPPQGHAARSPAPSLAMCTDPVPPKYGSGGGGSTPTASSGPTPHFRNPLSDAEPVVPGPEGGARCR